MREKLPVMQGTVVLLVLVVSVLAAVVSPAGVRSVSAQGFSSQADAVDTSELLAMDADSGTIVVTVCGLAVMVLSESQRTQIMLGASMASHLSDLEVDAGVQSDEPFGALELADHYHSIRENCKAVRKTNDRDALNERLEIDGRNVGRDEVI